MPSKKVEYDSKEWMKFFRNVKGGEAADPGHDSLDYSLQLAEGIDRHRKARVKAAADRSLAADKAALEKFLQKSH